MERNWIKETVTNCKVVINNFSNLSRYKMNKQNLIAGIDQSLELTSPRSTEYTIGLSSKTLANSDFFGID